MRSERQALADIAVECDKAKNDAVRRGRVTPYWVRAVEPILADVQPEPAPAGGTIDRDALRELLWLDDGVRKAYPGPGPRHELADRIIALVRPVGGTIDRDALIAAQRVIGEDPHKSADRILALVRPVEGVVISREEARDMAETLRSQAAISTRPGQLRTLEDLANRLEAAL